LLLPLFYKAFEEECIKTGKKTFSISDKQMKELYENKELFEDECMELIL
jgi:hypothetical protein